MVSCFVSFEYVHKAQSIGILRYLSSILIIAVFLPLSLLSQSLEFHETFKNNTNKWSIFQNRSATSKINNGHLSMKTHADRGLLNLIQHTVYPYQDFEISARILISSGTGNAGLVWGAMGNISFQAMRVYSDGTVNVVIKSREHLFEIIKRQRMSSHSLTIGDTVRLNVRKKKEKITFEINGYHLATTRFIPFSGTEIGFSIEGKMDVIHDDLRIYQELPAIKTALDSVTYVKTNLGDRVNSIYSENGVVVSADGKKMYLVRNGHPDNLGQFKKDDIWVSELDAESEWMTARRLGPPLNNTGSNFVISVSPDGNSLLVANTYKADGTAAGPGVSRSWRQEKGWSIPEMVVIDDFFNQSQFVDFALSPDQQVMLMAIDDGQTYGGMDLFASFKQGDGWGKPFNLGDSINSFANEFTPFMAADNVSLYFASFGHPGYGSADLFISRRLDDSWTNWTTPVNLGADINSDDWDANLSISAQGDYAYLTSSDSSIGEIDIYRIKLSENIKPNPVVILKGRVLNMATNNGIEASINYNALNDNTFLGEARSEPANGTYRLILPVG